MDHLGVRLIVVTSGNNSLYEKVCAELKEEQIRLPVFRASTVGEAASLTKRMEKSVVITDSPELADVKEQLSNPERSTLLGGAPQLPEKGSCEEEVAYIRFYIRMHIDEELNLNRLSSVIGLSPNYLCTMFHRETGVKLGYYIKRSRLEKAAYLLETEQTLIEDIAIRVGFANASYFSKQFKDEFGLSPRAYRAEFRSRREGL